jgi:hypothetical protein
MTEQPPSSHHDDAFEAELALRRAEREAETRARGLGARLAEVDVHQVEARRVLARAGMLTRRKRP